MSRNYQEIYDSKAYKLLRMVIPERSAFSIVWRVFSGPNNVHRLDFEAGCAKLLTNLANNEELTEWLDTERMLRHADQKEIANLKAQRDSQERSTLGYFDERYKEAHKILFHDDPTDLPERRNRFLEEVFELVQVLGMPRHEVIKLLDYTYGKKIGVMETELGDVASTFLSLLYQLGIPSHLVFTMGLETLFAKKDKIRAKRRTRHGRGPLPGLDIRPPARTTVEPWPEDPFKVEIPTEMKMPPHPWDADDATEEWRKNQLVHDEIDLTRGADEDRFPEARREALMKEIFTLVEKLATGGA